MNNRHGKSSVTTTVSAAAAVVQRNLQIMRITLALTILSFFTFSITLTSSYWVDVAYPAGFFSVRHNLFVVRTTYGVIWECVLGQPTRDSMYETRCDYHENKVNNASSPAERTLVGMNH
ncbi:unnamed protein product [Adineta ricciae]|uniref:Uncharacterized protein n=1 Tax=Adineta ricciae TaxID=249248 RepID=A0A814U9N2_ADIRI|nr:unnamed protein product [Adineta ricciae]